MSRSSAGQIAVGYRTHGTPGTGQPDPHDRRENRSIHRSRCRRPARLACAPAAGSAGCAGNRAGPTHPQRRTSAAIAVMSGGTAGPGACVTARSSPNVNTRGGSRASSPASVTSTTLPSTPRPRPEQAPPACCRTPTRRGGVWACPVQWCRPDQASLRSKPLSRGTAARKRLGQLAVFRGDRRASTVADAVQSISGRASTAAVWSTRWARNA
jgi:hypothetical protein